MSEGGPKNPQTLIPHNDVECTVSLTVFSVFKEGGPPLPC